MSSCLCHEKQGQPEGLQTHLPLMEVKPLAAHIHPNMIFVRPLNLTLGQRSQGLAASRTGSECVGAEPK